MAIMVTIAHATNHVPDDFDAFPRIPTGTNLTTRAITPSSSASAWR